MPTRLPLATRAPTQVFVTAHQSVEATSKKMFAQLKRQNYVTPTNYLETVRGYRSMLAEKRAELGDKAAKLRGGLEKLDETTVQVRVLESKSSALPAHEPALPTSKPGVAALHVCRSARTLQRQTTD